MLNPQLDFIFDLPAQLSKSEKLFLYSSILLLGSQNCLEIGAYKGGSTAIIALALDQVDGHLWSIDPNHRIAPELANQISHRVTWINGRSPDAVRQLDSKFDFVFIDGNHDQVFADCESVYPHLASRAFLVFHDAYYNAVKRDLDYWINCHSSELQDYGIVDRSMVQFDNDVNFGGLRALKYQSMKMLL